MQHEPHHCYRNVSAALPKLLEHLLHNGAQDDSRAGKTLERLHVPITLLFPKERELLVQYRKPNIAAQIAETVWVLAGRNDVAFLSHYLPRAADFSDDGLTWRAGYGPRLRSWQSAVAGAQPPIDQLHSVVQLLKEDRNTRRAVMSIFDPARDYVESKDIPCNNWLHFTIRNNRLHLHVAIRSNDIMWGWSNINTFEWSALQEIVAGLVGVDTGELHFAITSLHLYERHWDKAKKIVSEAPNYRLPVLKPSPQFGRMIGSVAELDAQLRKWIEIAEHIRRGRATQMIDRVNSFPDPLLRSWLRVIQWWWTTDRSWLEPLVGTRLEAATWKEFSVQPSVSMRPPLGGRVEYGPSPFLQYVNKLHAEKHAAYGDSWKRRGEMLGIMANIARKIDRLGQNGAGETAADTAIDLMVYLAKYRWWLVDYRDVRSPIDNERATRYNLSSGYSDHVEPVSALLGHIERLISHRWEKSKYESAPLERRLTDEFTTLEAAMSEPPLIRTEIVDTMLDRAYRLARTLWEAEQRANT